MAPLLLERTGGNPLFMTSIVNQLAQQEGRTPSAIVAIPHDVRRFIDRQIDELTESDRHLLTAASVIRREFATAAVAAALEIDVDQVEIACARLARQGVFVVKSGSTTWPDGTRAELYAFRHDLYRELLYDRLPATRRALCHTRVGRRLEAAWAGRLDAIASELAEHFERGNEPVRAIPHHQRAADKAMRRGANEEAIGHLRRALDAIGHIAGEAERTRVEVGLLVALGAAFFAIRGFGAPEVLEVYSRAEALCEGLGERTEIFPALWGQWLFRWGRSEVDAAGGFAKGCWRWPRNPAMPGSSCKPTTPPGRPRLAAADWRKSVPTPRPALPSTMREFIKPWRRATATMTPPAALAISVRCRWRWPAMTTARA